MSKSAALAMICVGVVAVAGCHGKADAAGKRRRPAAHAQATPPAAAPAASPASPAEPPPVRANPVYLQPRMTQAEAVQMAAAAGFTYKSGKIFSMCETPAAPKFAFTDLNGDGRIEALVASSGCDGKEFDILTRDASGRWSNLSGGQGDPVLLESRTRGWRDITVEGPGCQSVWRYDGAHYGDVTQCAEALAKQDDEWRKAEGFPPGPPPPLSSDDLAAAYRAAGFHPKGESWQRCADGDAAGEPTSFDSHIVDINGDGKSEVWITEGSFSCYGDRPVLVVMTRGADGKWKTVFDDLGVGGLRRTRHNGWLDIDLGGPGLGAMPFFKFNGKEYVYAGSQ